MKSGTRLFFLAIAICAAAGLILADQPPTFVKANQDYAAGHFQQAIDSYQNLVRSGQWSANLFYDLGNAWFRAGNFGEAILNYERALALDPHHPETEANLRLVRDEARALELKKNWIERYVYVGTPAQYSVLASLALWLAIFGLAHLYFARRRTVTAVAFVIVCVAVFGAGVFALYCHETGTRGKALAIVTGTNIEARLATAENASSVLALPSGSEIEILSQRGDWIYAALPNDLRGWIPANSAQLVRL